MNGEFLFRCIGSVDDGLIDMSVKRIGKIKNERRNSVFSALIAAVLMLVATPIGVMKFRDFNQHSTVDESPFIEMPVIEIENDYYQVLDEKRQAKYGLSETPDSNLIKEAVGTYYSVDKTMKVNIFTSTVSSEKNILIGECDGKFFYIVFCNKTHGELFNDARDFLEFFGYFSGADIVSMSVKGKKINDKETVEKFWDTISNSSIGTLDDYDHAVYQGEWTNDKAQENYNSSVTIELNVGMPSYLQIRYSSLAGFFISHDCYLKITHLTGAQ